MICSGGGRYNDSGNSLKTSGTLSNTDDCHAHCVPNNYFKQSDYLVYVIL